jgi:hypothetical protein
LRDVLDPGARGCPREPIGDGDRPQCETADAFLVATASLSRCR